VPRHQLQISLYDQPKRLTKKEAMKNMRTIGDSKKKRRREAPSEAGVKWTWSIKIVEYKYILLLGRSVSFQFQLSFQ